MKKIPDHQLIKLGNFFVDMTKLSKEDGFFRFAYQSRTHWMLICLIGSYQNKGISFEEACSKIDGSLASRSTIQNILENGHKQSYFFKKTSKRDKRIQIYFLTRESLDEVFNWVKRQEEIFA